MKRERERERSALSLSPSSSRAVDRRIWKKKRKKKPAINLILFILFSQTDLERHAFGQTDHKRGDLHSEACSVAARERDTGWREGERARAGGESTSMEGTPCSSVGRSVGRSFFPSSRESDF
jgi:hypothetical protein